MPSFVWQEDSKCFPDTSRADATGALQAAVGGEQRDAASDDLFLLPAEKQLCRGAPRGHFERGVDCDQGNLTRFQEAKDGSALF